MRPEGWTAADLTDQSGRQVLVTGTTVGSLGHHTALELARHGARVVLAGRSPDRLTETVEAITREVPDADLRTLRIDLTSLTSVRRAADEAVELGPVDVLVNNAGVMAPRRRRVTDDGFDLQMATNHLGPFLLTGLLLPQLADSQDGRVVTVSSMLHLGARRAPATADDLRASARPWPGYFASKLANLLFTYALDRRLRATGQPVRALAAHPGFASTGLIRNGPAMSVADAFGRAVGQPASAGAWPTLMAATADLPGGTFCGPSKQAGMRGPAAVVESSRLSHDTAAQERLWALSEEAVGLAYPG